jgi:hypothetical protein
VEGACVTIAALLALAERVEREAPSNQLDAEVWDTIGLTDDQKRHCQKWVRMDGRTDLTRFDFLRAWAPSYTSSIDAALKLVPSGSFFILTASRSRDEYQAAVMLAGSDARMLWHIAATPASALCAAALRAKAAATDGET